MGIAIPHWFIESQNSIWVLGVYGLLFGAGLPALVGRWWFGSRSYTKDGVRVDTAELFFKSIREDISDSEVVQLLGKALAKEKKTVSNTAIDSLKDQIVKRVGSNWASDEVYVLTSLLIPSFTGELSFKGPQHHIYPSTALCSLITNTCRWETSYRHVCTFITGKVLIPS